MGASQQRKDTAKSSDFTIVGKSNDSGTGGNNKKSQQAEIDFKLESARTGSFPSLGGDAAGSGTTSGKESHVTASSGHAASEQTAESGLGGTGTNWA